MENSNGNRERLIARFLTNDGGRFFCRSGICRELLDALLDSDLDSIEQNQIFFNVITFPATHSRINRSLSEVSHIITLDQNCFSQLSIEQGVAIILHELGHIFVPKAGDEGEFEADGFAAQRGYKIQSIESLKALKLLYPNFFVKSITDTRIAKLQQMP